MRCLELVASDADRNRQMHTEQRDPSRALFEFFDIWYGEVAEFGPDIFTPRSHNCLVVKKFGRPHSKVIGSETSYSDISVLGKPCCKDTDHLLTQLRGFYGPHVPRRSRHT
jgi:hypothetical protein